MLANIFYYMLLAIPLSLYFKYTHHELAMFFCACLAIIPLAGIMGQATESLACYMGEKAGGLINATFGNATELLITIFALKAGLFDVVKASIAGSILGNILLVLGLAILLGGIKNGEQTFDRVHVSNQTSLMFLAIIALIIPAVFFASPRQSVVLLEYSVVISAILLLIYLAGLLFSIRRSGAASCHTHEPGMTKRRALMALLLSTIFIALESELLVEGIEPTTAILGWSTFFVGIIIIPIIGNAAEHSTAVLMAWKNRTDLAFEIAVGSSTQIALLVTPLLVFIGLILGKPMNLIFNYYEIITVALAVLIAQFISLDGESNWLEGSLLLAAYAMIAIAFFFV